MASDTVSEIVRMADIEMAVRILKDVHPKHKEWLQR